MTIEGRRNLSLDLVVRAELRLSYGIFDLKLPHDIRSAKSAGRLIGATNPVWDDLPTDLRLAISGGTEEEAATNHDRGAINVEQSKLLIAAIQDPRLSSIYSDAILVYLRVHWTAEERTELIAALLRHERPTIRERGVTATRCLGVSKDPAVKSLLLETASSDDSEEVSYYAHVVALD